jgi:CO/xanthine dehydrogenase Mo-binding subunit
MQIHGAMLALHTNRPVKMVYNREESFVGHIHRHPARIWAEHRAKRDGKLACIRMRILLDGGAYASSSTAVTSNAASFACGPYAVENALIEATCVYTNNPPCGAMRGFGAVQTCFAAEAQMDKLAEALGLDPIELRLRNALAPGDTLPTGQKVTGSLPVAEVIRRSAAVSGSRSGSRTSATPRASTTTARRASGCSRTPRASSSPRCTAPPRRWVRA